jgi:hypothetical protein
MHGHMSRCTVTCHDARSHERKMKLYIYVWNVRWFLLWMDILAKMACNKQRQNWNIVFLSQTSLSVMSQSRVQSTCQVFERRCNFKSYLKIHFLLLSKKKNYVSGTQAKGWIFYREMIAVYLVNYMKHMDILCGKIEGVFQELVHILVTTSLNM